MSTFTRGDIIGILFIDQNGRTYPTFIKIKLNESERDRELRIMENFLNYQKRDYHIPIPQKITGRDCPWDFTYDKRLYFEITSLNYNENIDRVNSYLKVIKGWKEKNDIQRNLVYVLTDRMSKKQIPDSLKLYFRKETNKKKPLDTTDVNDLNILIHDVKKMNWETFVIYEHINPFPYDIPILINNKETSITDIVNKRLQEKIHKKYPVEKELTIILDNRSPILQESIETNWDSLIKITQGTKFKSIFLYTEISPTEFFIIPLKTP